MRGQMTPERAKIGKYVILYPNKLPYRESGSKRGRRHDPQILSRENHIKGEVGTKGATHFLAGYARSTEF